MAPSGLLNGPFKFIDGHLGSRMKPGVARVYLSDVLACIEYSLRSFRREGSHERASI